MHVNIHIVARVQSNAIYAILVYELDTFKCDQGSISYVGYTSQYLNINGIRNNLHQTL
jgi:hypothetical protein